MTCPAICLVALPWEDVSQLSAVLALADASILYLLDSLIEQPSKYLIVHKFCVYAIYKLDLKLEMAETRTQSVPVGCSERPN